MIDLTNLKAPGWQRIVADLSSPVPDDRTFLLRLISALGQVAGARQAVLWLTPSTAEGSEARAVLVWPPLDQGAAASLEHGPLEAAHIDESAIPHAAECKTSARTVAGTSQTRVFGLEGQDDLMYDPGQAAKGYLLAVPVPGSTLTDANTPVPSMGAITLLLDGRSKAALQTTLALVEVIAGYVFGHWTRQALKRTRSSTAGLDLATRLIASMNATEGFKGAGLQFVNDLARNLAVDRVALSWIKGPGNVRAKGQVGRRFAEMVAMSDTENLDRRMALVQRLEAAMDECLDQDQTILYPPPPLTGPGSDAVLSAAITHSHRELAASDAKLRVASFPLRVGDAQGDRVVGVLLIESTGDGRIDASGVELVQATLDLVAPVLAVRHSDDRIIALRVWDWLLKTGAWAVGPKHTVWKLAGIAVMLATLFAVFYTTPYRFGAPLELQPRERRTISAPFDGTIARLGEGVEPGGRVDQGQLLLEFDTTDRRLSALEAQAQIVQYDKEADEQLKKGALSESQQAAAKSKQSQAKLWLLEHEIAKARVTAPIPGVITAGDLKDKVGAAVKLGDRLFEMADLTDMVVIARVDDSDIALVYIGQTGEMSPKSDPSLTVPFTVERIVPLSTAAEGANAFEVHCKLSQPPSWFRPGMEGHAKFNGPTRSIAWIGTRRILNTLRVWLWW